MMMKIWFDTEFIEDGKTIELISIGMVRADGNVFYREAECDHSKADDWVKQNVLTQLTGDTVPREQIRNDILAFCGESPEFWAYYADYDWVVLCQLFGRMIDLPDHWPMFCNDVQQLRYNMGASLPEQESGEHNALSDALWTKIAYEFLTTTQ